jgi:hypothetical protein
MNMRFSIGVAALLTVCLVPSPARAAAITFNLDGFVTGQAPTSTGPWLTLTFSDLTPGLVQLVVQSGLEVTTEFVGDVVFNIGGGIDPLAVAFAENTAFNIGSFQSPAISQSLNNVDRSPLQDFDFGLAFETSNASGGAQRFNLADKLVYGLTCSTSLDADCATFNALSFSATNLHTHLGGPWAAAAHFQGIPAGVGSGKFGAKVPPPVTITQVPEPLTLLLFGVGAAGLAGKARRRRHLLPEHSK